jgi:DNA replication and repair protein RecF
MSRLSHITIHNLRNLAAVDISPGPKINLLYGPNGSGKSSFLEAIHLLGLGRSFRTHLNSRVIEHNQPQFQLHAKVSQANGETPIGLAKQRSGQTTMKISGNPVTSIVSLAELLPLQLLFPDGHTLIKEGPKVRRQFIDWGVFHVEHQFYSHWQRAERAIKQRNAVLKTRLNTSAANLAIWDQEICAMAALLDESRSNYIKQLTPTFNALLTSLLPEAPVTLDYYRGWSNEFTLSEVLIRNRPRDFELGYTQLGPHRAEIILNTNGLPVKDTLSQGQHKTLIYALRLAQGCLLHQQTAKSPVYLIDDLPAELDEAKLTMVGHLLNTLEAQVYITGTHKNLFSSLIEIPDTKMFHVKHGLIVPDI